MVSTRTPPEPSSPSVLPEAKGNDAAKYPLPTASSAEAEKAMKTLRQVLDAAENSNQRGEDLAVIMALGPSLYEISQFLREENERLKRAEPKPLHAEVSCSQCGGAFGPGNYGYSHCDSHGKPDEMTTSTLAHALCHLRGPWLSKRDDAVLLEVTHRLYSTADYFDSKMLTAALDERGMWINPEMFEQAANEIDCCGGSHRCDHVWHESDTNASGCEASERGDYCPNDLAETLRAVAKCARANLSTPAVSAEQFEHAALEEAAEHLIPHLAGNWTLGAVMELAGRVAALAETRPEAEGATTSGGPQTISE